MVFRVTGKYRPGSGWAIDLFLPSLASLLHDSDLFLRQPIQIIDQGVDLLVGGVDLRRVRLLAGGDGLAPADLSRLQRIGRESLCVIN